MLDLYPLGARQSTFDVRDVDLDEVRRYALFPPRSKIWDFPEAAPCDQGLMGGQSVPPEKAGHCGGGALWNWLALTPVSKPYLNDYLHVLYYGMCLNAGRPNTEDGVEGRWLPAYAVKLKRAGSYARARSVASAKNFLLSSGPMPIAAPWLEGMDAPDLNGVVHATGRIRGWHYFDLRGFDVKMGYPCQQSWGRWALDGKFWLPEPDFAALLAYGAEVYAMLEKPLPARIRARIDGMTPLRRL